MTMKRPGGNRSRIENRQNVKMKMRTTPILMKTTQQKMKNGEPSVSHDIGRRTRPPTPKQIKLKIRY